MTVLHEIYGGTDRNWLKCKIKEKFLDQLFLILVDGKTAHVVIESESLNSLVLINNPDLIIKDILRNDIQEYSQNHSEVPWPPYIEELSLEIRKPPELLTSFIFCLLVRHTIKDLY